MKIDLSTFSDMLCDPEFQFVVLVVLFVLSWLFMVTLALIEFAADRRHRSRSPVDRLLRHRHFGGV